MITTDEPQVKASSRYTIGQTCSILNISRKTLAKYTVAGLIQCGYRKPAMRKFYTGTAILTFWRAAL